MNKKIKKRVVNEANCIIKSEKTVREVAKIFNVSKSTVHKDMQDRLSLIDKELYKKINDIFKYHIMIRHINGGMSTKQKYLNLKKE